MRKSRFTGEQIIGVLKEHQVGLVVAELRRQHGISDTTFYTWRSFDRRKNDAARH